MSTITNIQPKGCYNFSIEKPTQSMDRKLLIEQSNEGLKVSVKEGDKINYIEKHLINGLPKTGGLVPKKFFDSCTTRFSDSSSQGKVDFMPKLLGGMKKSVSDDAYSFGTDRNFTQIKYAGLQRTEKDMEVLKAITAIKVKHSPCLSAGFLISNYTPKAIRLKSQTSEGVFVLPPSMTLPKNSSTGAFGKKTPGLLSKGDFSGKIQLAIEGLSKIVTITFRHPWASKDDTANPAIYSDIENLDGINIAVCTPLKATTTFFEIVIEGGVFPGFN